MDKNKPERTLATKVYSTSQGKIENNVKRPRRHRKKIVKNELPLFYDNSKPINR